MKSRLDKKFLIASLAICAIFFMAGFPTETDAKAASAGKAGISLKEGRSVTLKIKKAKKKVRRVTWKSKNKKIATVSKKGRVKAKSAGNTKITAKVTLRNGKKYTSIYKVCVRKKKNAQDPSGTALPKKPTPTATALPQKPTANPAVSPQPPAKPKIQAVSEGQCETAGWETLRAEAVWYASTSDELVTGMENQFVTSLVQSIPLMRQLKVTMTLSEANKLIDKFAAYDEKYFQNHVLCMVNVQLPCGYRPSIKQVYQKDNEGGFPDLMVQYEKVREYGDDQVAPGVLVNHIFGLEIEREALKGFNGAELPGATAAPPVEDMPIVIPDPTSTATPQPEIGMVSTAQEPVADWKPIQTESISCMEMECIPRIKNQLITSYDELAALIEELKAEADLFSCNKPLVAELEEYDEEYFENHALCLLVVELTCGYTPSVKQVYSSDSGGGKCADIMMKYAKIKEYGDDQCVPTVLMHHVYRIEIAKSEMGLGTK